MALYINKAYCLRTKHEKGYYSITVILIVIKLKKISKRIKRKRYVHHIV